MENQEKRVTNKVSSQVSEGSGKLGKYAALHLKQQDGADTHKTVIRDTTEQFQ